MNNIVLTGMPGSGKSTTGVVLAKLAGYGFADTDLIMAEKLGKPLPVIAAELSYDEFIRQEGLIGEGIELSRTVIATGGSMPLSVHAMEHLRQNSTVVWLNCPVEELKRRIPPDLASRGVVSKNGQTLDDIAAIREPFYRASADIIVDCTGNTEAVARRIIQLLSELESTE